MNESIKKYMRVGLIHFMAYPSVSSGTGPIEETLKKIAIDDYFDAVEITWIKDGKIRKKAKKMIETAHMSVAYSAGPRLMQQGLNINDLNEDGRVKAVATLEEGIDEAYENGCEGFGYLSGRYPKDAIGKEEAYNALVKSTMEICEYSKARGNLKIALEVFDYDIDKNALIGPASLARRFAKEIRNRYENFGLMVDLSHIPLIKETIQEAILPIKDYIIHAHMGNCVLENSNLPGYGDQHPRFGFPDSENDVNELAEYIKLLMSIGFISEEKRPIVSFEVKPFGDEDPELVIANAKRVLNAAWAKL
ncbi:MAG TPA: sugar phosphate isomerase/epimerase [Clostridium sp.]|uniref:sugar phosphate isomerase/epimerase family protein n=1 Tax=Clostridium sp. TaxID=1506 RepID=UPI002F9230FE